MKELMQEYEEGVRGMIEYPGSGILSKSISADEMMIVDATLFCMAKDAKMSEHTSKKEGIIYVIEGRGTFILEGEKIGMHPGTMIHMDKDAVHSLNADENTSFILFLYG